jgi:SAM-dependent methyltransferase
VPLTKLSQHEYRVARRFDRAQRGRTAGAALQRALRTPLGNYLVNTPLFLLPRTVNLQPKHRVLEVGCSRGANLRFLTARVRFHKSPVGIDLSRGALRAAAQHGRGAFELVAGSGSRLPFADSSFDLVVAAHVLRHLDGEGFIRFLVEARRVLKPGGLLAVWEYTAAEPKRPGAFRSWLLGRLGGRGTLRDFAALAHWASEANFDVIENPNLRPFLFPPVPRVSMLARRPPADPAAGT